MNYGTFFAYKVINHHQRETYGKRRFTIILYIFILVIKQPLNRTFSHLHKILPKYNRDLNLKVFLKPWLSMVLLLYLAV